MFRWLTGDIVSGILVIIVVVLFSRKRSPLKVDKAIFVSIENRMNRTHLYGIIPLSVTPSRRHAPVAYYRSRCRTPYSSRLRRNPSVFTAGRAGFVVNRSACKATVETVR